MSEQKILLPNIGDFEAVEIIEIPISNGDRIAKEDTMMTVESDKASMDIPSPADGIVQKIAIKIGDKISQGDLILHLTPIEATNTDQDTTSTAAQTPDSPPAEQAAITDQATTDVKADMHCQVVVLGGGPGGYTAAFRAADLGKQTILVERYPTLGGVCLNVGCIPSKSLLHIAKITAEIEDLKKHGIEFGAPKINPQCYRKYATDVISTLTTGLKAMAKKRKVEVVHGVGKFATANMLEVTDADGKKTTISFEHAIIAAGSQPTTLSSFPQDPRILDSTSALLLENIPKRLLIIGGGIIGLEMATIYHALGTKITIVEMLDNLVAGCDQDIVRPLQMRIKKHYENIYLKTTVTDIQANKTHLRVSFNGKKAPEHDDFDAILLSIGRQPNGLKIAAENAGVQVDERGFISVDDQQRTNIPNIFAIGDIVGQPMLAHKATHEGKLAAEVIAGLKHAFDNRSIPSVAYTDPEIAWVGLTETAAKAQGIAYEKGKFPWAASGRSLSVGRTEGVSKLLFDPQTKRIIGAAIVGPNAGELIAECTLAIEMGADAEDIGLTIHPHPTLSETVGLAAEVFEGTITDLYMPKK